MKIVIIGVIIIAIALAVGVYTTMNESDTGSDETKQFVNKSDQFYEEELTPEGNNYSITLTETVGMEIVP